jgi:hypothetical protein
MTHDELLIEINRRLEVALYNGDHQSIHALLAVVELHKPFDFKLGNELLTSCEGCDEPDYPCKTIQAIEKEL